MTATDFAVLKIARRPASSSTTSSVHSLMPPTFSRRPHRGKDLRAEGLDAPPPDTFHARQRLEVAGRGFRDGTPEPIRQDDARLEPRRGLRVGPPLPQQLDPPPHPPPHQPEPPRSWGPVQLR